MKLDDWIDRRFSQEVFKHTAGVIWLLICVRATREAAGLLFNRPDFVEWYHLFEKFLLEALILWLALQLFIALWNHRIRIGKSLDLVLA